MKKRNNMSKIDLGLDLERLSQEIKVMKRWQPLYKVLKKELSALGFWKLRSRGDPKKGFREGFGKDK